MRRGPASRAEMAVGSARRAVISAADALVAERARPALRIRRAQRVARRVDAAERGAAVGVPQALRRRRRSVGAGAARSTTGRARSRWWSRTPRGTARRRRAALTAGRVVVAEDHAAGAAGRAAVLVAAAVGAGLVGLAGVRRRCRTRATQLPTTQTRPVEQSVSTLHGVAGMPPFGLPPPAVGPVPVVPLPPVVPVVPPRRCRPSRRHSGSTDYRECTRRRRQSRGSQPRHQEGS